MRGWSSISVQLWDCSAVILLLLWYHFLLCQPPLSERLSLLPFINQLHWLMHCQFVNVSQLFDLLRYCITAWCYIMTISAGIHSWMCIFLSTDTNIFCISLSFPFLCHIFSLLYSSFFLSPLHPILLFPSFVHGSASLPHITLLMRLPSPSGLLHLTIFGPFFYPYPISSFLTPTLPRPVFPTLLPPLCPPFLSPRLL